MHFEDISKKEELFQRNARVSNSLLMAPCLTRSPDRMDQAESLMALHLPIRDIVGALEKKLADELTAAGYNVMNTVKWQPALGDKRWRRVRKAFEAHFAKLTMGPSSEH